MTELSKEAQAVLDALYMEELNGPQQMMARAHAAAALYAAADQVAPTQEDREAAPEYHSQVFFSGMEYAAMELRAIAAELEGQ